MIITEISAQKRKSRYNLFVDDYFYSGLDAEAIIKNGLKVGLEINETLLNEIVTESEVRSAFEKLITIISRQMYTKFEIKQKLIKYGYKEHVVELAIKKAEEYGYVNDEMFAKMFVDNKKNKSKLEVKSMLMKKGVSKQIVDNETLIIDLEQEKKSVLILAEKYMKNKEVNQKTMSGLYGFLSRKGFSLESVKFALRKYKFEEFQD